MQGSGGVMTEHRARTARQRRGHPAAARRDVRVPDRVDGAMDPMQPAGLEPALDAAVRIAECRQLPQGHGPVLAGGQLRQGFVV